MGCGNCGTGANGLPGGCKGNGGCSTGGCNRLNVYDWLNTLPLHDSAKPFPIIEVSFSEGSRKEFFRNNTHHILEKGSWIALEGMGGYDIGQVSLTGELVKLQLKKYGVRENEVTKRVLHPATEEELQNCGKQKAREAEVLMRSRAIARTLNLDMKLCEVEIQADSKKGTFFYTADQRVDFRELIKLYAGDFKMKVEMKQIGARQESGKVGGIGSCGRELCCSTWLTDFKSVNTTAARYQNLSINQTKLSGQCGRLKCCLNYELDTYMDALSVFPDNAEHIETVKGMAHLQKRDIFKNLMWYSYSDNNKQYPLTIARVKEIVKLNKQGEKADELHPVELETRESKNGGLPDEGFVNDVGSITLKNLENKKKKKKGGGKDQGRDQQGQQAGAPRNRPETGTQQPEDGQPAEQTGGRQQQPGNRQQAGGNQQQNRKGQQKGNNQQQGRRDAAPATDNPQQPGQAEQAQPGEGRQQNRNAGQQQRQPREGQQSRHQKNGQDRQRQREGQQPGEDQDKQQPREGQQPRQQRDGQDRQRQRDGQQQRPPRDGQNRPPRPPRDGGEQPGEPGADGRDRQNRPQRPPRQQGPQPESPNSGDAPPAAE